MAGSRKLIAVLTITLVGVATSCGSEAEPTAETPATTAVSTSEATIPGSDRDCRGTGTQAQRDLQYVERTGVDPNHLSLDLYEPVREEGCPPAPVVVYVHGGGFQNGDKANKVGDKAAVFNAEGWAFVSINYRLWGDPSSGAFESGYPGQVQDLAAGLAWLSDNAETYDLDPDQLLLMGHSAGAFLAAAVATDSVVLDEAGVGADQIRCAVPIDTEGYDVTTNVDRPGTNHWDLVFPDPSTWESASPLVSVSDGQEPPDFLVVVRGSPARIAASQDFADAVRVAGSEATVLVADQYSHEEVNAAVGLEGETLVTDAILRLFRGCLDPGGRLPGGR